MNDQIKLIFATPIMNGKADLLTDFPCSQVEESQLLSDIGISKYCRWVQNIRGEKLLIHLIEGENPSKSFEALREKTIQGDPTAIKFQNLYLEVLGKDLGKKEFLPKTVELTEMLSVDIENSHSFTKEYCFVYPLISSKKDKLLYLFREKEIYDSEMFQNIRKFRGVAKQQLWIQESEDNSYIVMYQEIAGPVSDSRDKFLNSKEDSLSNFLAMEFSDISGLSYEELLPKLESLADAEVLN